MLLGQLSSLTAFVNVFNNLTKCEWWYLWNLSVGTANEFGTFIIGVSVRLGKGY